MVTIGEENRYDRNDTNLFRIREYQHTNQPGFQSTLDYIREAAQSERQKGDLLSG